MGKLSLNGDRLYKRYGAYRAGTLIREAGFTAIDFSFMPMAKDENHPFLQDNYLEIAHDIRAEYDKAGIEVNQAHSPFAFPLDLFWKDEALETIIYPRMIRAMEMASILGAKIIIIHPIHYICIGEEEAFRRSMEFYNVLKPYCEKFGIKIAVENMWDRDPKRGCIIHDSCSRSDEFIRYIDELNHPDIVACLDVGHVGLAWREDETYDMIHALGKDRLKALHIHDNNYRDDDHAMPFRGQMDWESIGKALGEIGYEGDFTYEVSEKLFTTGPDCIIPSLLKLYYDVLKYISDVADSYRK